MVRCASTPFAPSTEVVVIGGGTVVAVTVVAVTVVAVIVVGEAADAGGTVVDATGPVVVWRVGADAGRGVPGPRALCVLWAPRVADAVGSCRRSRSPASTNATRTIRTTTVRRSRSRRRIRLDNRRRVGDPPDATTIRLNLIASLRPAVRRLHRRATL
jgi:hypothetical protein